MIAILSDVYRDKVIEEFYFQETLLKEHISHYHYDFFYSEDYKGNPFIFVIKHNKYELRKKVQ